MTLTEMMIEENSNTGWTTAGLDVQFKVVKGVLFIQGSKSKEDWKHNFDTYADVYCASDIEIKAHKGFRDMWLSIKPEIEKLEFDTIFGHSLGGALALFAHENYHHRFGVQPMTYAIGCPRVFYKPSWRLKERMKNVIRIKHRFDIVTFVPLLIMGFRHVGQKRILKNTLDRPKAMGLLYYLSFHSPEQYIHNLGGR